MSKQNQKDYFKALIEQRRALAKSMPDVNFGHNFEVVEDVVWAYEHGGVAWNTDKNLEDLQAGSGATYANEINWKEFEDDDYLLVDTDDGQGNRHERLLFLKSEMVTLED